MTDPNSTVDTLDQVVYFLAMIGGGFVILAFTILGVLFYGACKQAKVDAKNSTLTR